jgi:hypothetical protein
VWVATLITSWQIAVISVQFTRSDPAPSSPLTALMVLECWLSGTAQVLA